MRYFLGLLLGLTLLLPSTASAAEEHSVPAVTMPCVPDRLYCSDGYQTTGLPLNRLIRCSQNGNGFAYVGGCVTCVTDAKRGAKCVPPNTENPLEGALYYWFFTLPLLLLLIGYPLLARFWLTTERRFWIVTIVYGFLLNACIVLFNGSVLSEPVALPQTHVILFAISTILFAMATKMEKRSTHAMMHAGALVLTYFAVFIGMMLLIAWAIPT